MTLKIEKSFRGLLAKFVVIGFLTAFIIITASFQTAFAQTAPTLGTAGSFAVLGGSAVTNTGPTVITGDLGVSPGTAITGFPPGIVVGGATHAADAVALQAQNDTTTAYNELASQPCDTTFSVPTDIGGMTLVPGVYCFASSVQLTGTLTLNAGGNGNAVWIFKVGSTLITASNSKVSLINGAQQCNDFWQVGSSATLGTSTAFIGNILALTSISLDTNATVSGRTLARNGAVTMDSNTVSPAACVPPPVTPTSPTLGKAFSPATINAGGTSALTITLSNSDATAASITSPLVDNLPAGVVIGSTPSSTTCGGIVMADAGSSSITLTGGSIPANGSCTVTVPVTAANSGSFINSIAAGALVTSNGNNSAPAVATLTVNTPAAIAPTVNKAFSPATIAAGGTSTLTITLSNAGGTADTMTAPLTDTLPTGVLVSGAATTSCGGTAAATVGGSTVTLTGGSIPANGSCTLTVPVTAANAGNFVNSIAAGALQTNNGNNAGPGVSTLTVTGPGPTPTPTPTPVPTPTPAPSPTPTPKPSPTPTPVPSPTPIPKPSPTPTPVPIIAPTLTKVFAPATINMGASSTLTITLHNASSTIDKLTAPLVDQFPLDVILVGGGSNTCGGVVTATKGSSKVTLTGGSIPAKGSCTVTVAVTTTDCDGPHVNTIPIGALQTSKGHNPAAAVATLTIVNPPGATTPRVFKTFVPTAIKANGTSVLSIYLINHAAVAAKLTAPLIDNLPAGVVISGGGITTCGGVLTALKGSSKITLTGGSIPANSQCQITANVTASRIGQFINTIGAGTLHATTGTNVVGTVATLTVSTSAGTPPKVGKTFSPVTILSGGTSVLNITLTNPNATVATLTAPFTDVFPSGIIVSGGASTSCGGTVTAVKGSSQVTLTGGSIPASGSCKVTLTIAAEPSCKGLRTNEVVFGALQTNKGANTVAAFANITVN
jgi:Ice-binding-like